MNWLRWPSVQIALCVAVYLAVGWRFGPFALVMTSPLLAIAVAVPLMHLVANIRHRMREEVWLPEHGHHFAYRDHTIHVLEDDDRCRWVRLADARRVVPIAATDRVLGIAYPGRVQLMGRPQEVHLRDDALIELLVRDGRDAALRFRAWVERDIAVSGRTIRKQLGIRPDPPEFH